MISPILNNRIPIVEGRYASLNQLPSVPRKLEIMCRGMTINRVMYLFLDDIVKCRSPEAVCVIESDISVSWSVKKFCPVLNGWYINFVDNSNISRNLYADVKDEGFDIIAICDDVTYRHFSSTLALLSKIICTVAYYPKDKIYVIYNYFTLAPSYITRSGIKTDPEKDVVTYAMMKCNTHYKYLLRDVFIYYGMDYGTIRSNLKRIKEDARFCIINNTLVDEKVCAEMTNDQLNKLIASKNEPEIETCEVIYH